MRFAAPFLLLLAASGCKSWDVAGLDVRAEGRPARSWVIVDDDRIPLVAEWLEERRDLESAEPGPVHAVVRFARLGDLSRVLASSSTQGASAGSIRPKVHGETHDLGWRSEDAIRPLIELFEKYGREVEPQPLEQDRR